MRKIYPILERINLKTGNLRFLHEETEVIFSIDHIFLMTVNDWNY